MVRSKNATIEVIIIVVICITMLIANLDLKTYSIQESSSLSARLLYSFIHVNILHAFMNLSTLLILWYYYYPKAWMVITSYLIAISYPAALFHTAPTVGLSGFCYAFMALLSIQVLRKKYWHRIICCLILLSFCIPHFNGYIHLYCYLMGMCVVEILHLLKKRE
jgi:membrane associated rhomboid family serine protease